MNSGLRIVVVTGLSGAGKSRALRILEDLGFFCVDNLPSPMARRFAELATTRPDIGRVALGIDVRGRAFEQGAADLVAELREAGYDVSVLFLDASDEALVARFSESRRPHPLAPGGDVLAGVAAERRVMAPLREQADNIVDTTYLSVHELRRLLSERMRPVAAAAGTAVRFMSFGFRHGVPVDADIVLDVRFLPNPHFVKDLKSLPGTDPAVAQYVLAHDEAGQLLARVEDLLRFLIPLYRREGKAYLTVAVGCTGGRHRSVALVEELVRRLDLSCPVSITHRDINREVGGQTATREVTR